MYLGGKYCIRLFQLFEPEPKISVSGAMRWIRENFLLQTEFDQIVIQIPPRLQTEIVSICNLNRAGDVGGIRQNSKSR